MSGRVAILSAALSLMGCVYSDHSLCSPDKLVFDPELEGTWDSLGNDGADLTVHVSANRKTRSHDAEIIPNVPKSKEKSVKGRMCLVDLNGERFLSFHVDRDTTGHRFLIGEFIDAKVRVDKRLPGWIGVQVIEREGAQAGQFFDGLERRSSADVVTTGGAPDTDLILTATTADLQRTVSDPNRRAMFAHELMMRKRVPTKRESHVQR